MRKTELRSKVVETEVEVELRCDLCDKVASGIGWSSSRWDVNEYEAEVTIRGRDGESYPEGGSGKEYSVDLCPDCFKDRLLPWLVSQGANPRIRDWDW